MSEEKELKLACLHQAGGDLDHAQRLFDWVSGSVRATPDSEAAEVSAPKQDKPQQPFNYQHPSKYGTDVPRRCYLEELTPEERAIRDLVDTVERLGAHPLLTATVIQLMKAGEDLADWVDIGLRDKAIAALSPGNDLGLLDENPAAVDTEVRNKAEGEAWHRYVVKGGEDYCDYATLAEAEAAFAKLEVARKAELEEANRGEIIRKIAAANAYHEVRFGDRWRVGSELESQPGVSDEGAPVLDAGPPSIRRSDIPEGVAVETYTDSGLETVKLGGQTYVVDLDRVETKPGAVTILSEPEAAYAPVNEDDGLMWSNAFKAEAEAKAEEPEAKRPFWMFRPKVDA